MDQLLPLSVIIILRLLNFRELFLVFSIGIEKSKLNRGWIFINTYIYLTRSQLYNEVWQSSIRGVAQKYDLNYDSLFRKFRDEKIPHPDNSYLTRKEHGENVESQVKPLSGDPDKRIKLLTNRVVAPSEFALEDRTKQLQELSSPNCLSFLTVADKNTACREISTITAEKNAPEKPAVAGYIQLNRQRFSEKGARPRGPRAGRPYQRSDPAWRANPLTVRTGVLSYLSRRHSAVSNEGANHTI